MQKKKASGCKKDIGTQRQKTSGANEEDIGMQKNKHRDAKEKEPVIRFFHLFATYAW